MRSPGAPFLDIYHLGSRTAIHPIRQHAHTHTHIHTHTHTHIQTHTHACTHTHTRTHTHTHTTSTYYRHYTSVRTWFLLLMVSKGKVAERFVFYLQALSALGWSPLPCEAAGGIRTWSTVKYALTTWPPVTHSLWQQIHFHSCQGILAGVSVTRFRFLAQQLTAMPTGHGTRWQRIASIQR